MRGPLLGLLVLTLVAPTSLAASERTVRVSLMDEGCPDGADGFCIDPPTIEIDEGDTVTLLVTNDGQVQHNLTFGPDVPGSLAAHSMDRPLAPNETVEIQLPWEDIQSAIDTAERRSFELGCGQEGHRALGETTRLVVAQGAGENPQPLGWGVAGLAIVGAALLVAGRRG